MTKCNFCAPELIQHIIEVPMIPIVAKAISHARSKKENWRSIPNPNRKSTEGGK